MYIYKRASLKDDTEFQESWRQCPKPQQKRNSLSISWVTNYPSVLATANTSPSIQQVGSFIPYTPTNFLIFFPLSWRQQSSSQRRECVQLEGLLFDHYLRNNGNIAQQHRQIPFRQGWRFRMANGPLWSWPWEHMDSARGGKKDSPAFCIRTVSQVRS